MTTWTLALTGKPMTLNHRYPHWRVKAAANAALRDETAIKAAAAMIPAQRFVDVRLGYIPPNRRRRDVDNYVASLKPICDGLVRAGVVPDDTPEFMAKHMPDLLAIDKDATARLIVTITGLESYQ